MSWIANLSLLASILVGAGFAVLLDHRFLNRPPKIETTWRPDPFVPGRRDRRRHRRDEFLKFLIGRTP
jgi:hypothetical protein